MKPKQQICIVQCGACTPVGTTAPMTAAMVRAEVSRLRRHPFFNDESSNQISMGIASYLDEDLDGLDRLTLLANPALEEVLSPLADLKPGNKKLPVSIGLPEYNPGFSNDTSLAFEDNISKTLSGYDEFDFIVQTYPQGHAAGLMAMEEACLILSRNEAEFCVIGGVESYYTLDTLLWLYGVERLRCSENNFGFIPGEASGFCLLTTVETTQKYQLPVLAEILALSTKEEPCPIGDKTSICKGEGLSKVFADVLKHLPENRKIDQVYCDLNGERYRTDEYGFAYLRNKDFFQSANGFISPVNCWGDIGAATAPNLLNIAIQSGLNDYAKGPLNLIWASSDAGKRSALLIELP